MEKLFAEEQLRLRNLEIVVLESGLASNQSAVKDIARRMSPHYDLTEDGGLKANRSTPYRDGYPGQMTPNEFLEHLRLGGTADHLFTRADAKVANDQAPTAPMSPEERIAYANDRTKDGAFLKSPVVAASPEAFAAMSPEQKLAYANDRNRPKGL